MNADGRRRRNNSLRLRQFDYAAPCAYFITVCAAYRRCMLARIAGDRVQLSEAGQAAQEVWRDHPSHYLGVSLDAFVIMPDHVHGILVLEAVEEGRPAGVRRHGLSEVVRGFKTFSARRINLLRETPGRPVWQRGFYDHVIRDDRDLERIRKYILHNPLRWSIVRGSESWAR